MILKRDALIDETGSYRYSLRRQWDNSKKRVLWIMLNPSTADNQGDDPTIEACIRFTKKWGYGSFEVVNLFAYRATEPSMLKKITKDEAIGTENMNYICDALERADLIVAAWGENGKIHKRYQDDDLITLFKQYELKCLRILTDGNPGHPLYVGTDTSLKDFKLTKIINSKPTMKRQNRGREESTIGGKGNVLRLLHEDLRDEFKVFLKQEYRISENSAKDYVGRFNGIVKRGIYKGESEMTYTLKAAIEREFPNSKNNYLLALERYIKFQRDKEK